MNIAVMQRIHALMALLQTMQKSLLSGVVGTKAIPKFFDFDEAELDNRYVEILDKVEECEEWEASEMLEMAAIFLLMYLKQEFETIGG